AEDGISVVALDVADDSSMTGVVGKILADHGRIDVLVNNAGYGSYGSVEDVPLAEGRYQLEVNLFGLARLTQLVTPQMRAAGAGKIVNVSSIGGHLGEPLGAWYHASKFAVEGFSDSLRLELHPFGIDVIVMEPGAIRTEWGKGALESAEKYSGDSAYGQQVHAMRALYSHAERRGSEPEIVAEAIFKAISAAKPKARYAVPFSAKAIIAAMNLVPDRLMDAGRHAAMARLSKPRTRPSTTDE
ncbi:MAG TPA: SDR family NAD(P)-dependent oxidoreductase, partial [Propionibacteriaceae bacterium]|nr:SDR family NAD(P)-dependent oxidoreductase [Propionibacteriaceae bacterium]